MNSDFVLPFETWLAGPGETDDVDFVACQRERADLAPHPCVERVIALPDEADPCWLNSRHPSVTERRWATDQRGMGACAHAMGRLSRELRRSEGRHSRRTPPATARNARGIAQRQNARIRIPRPMSNTTAPGSPAVYATNGGVGGDAPRGADVAPVGWGPGLWRVAPAGGAPGAGLLGAAFGGGAAPGLGEWPGAELGAGGGGVCAVVGTRRATGGCGGGVGGGGGGRVGSYPPKAGAPPPRGRGGRTL